MWDALCFIVDLDTKIFFRTEFVVLLPPANCIVRLWNGAYSAAEKYSRSDVKALVEFGRARGVKIMIEFDMPGRSCYGCQLVPLPPSPVAFYLFSPCALTSLSLSIPACIGHAASWCTGYPEICPSPSCLQPLDPSSNTTFPLITSLLSECTGADPSAALAKPYSTPKKAAGKQTHVRRATPPAPAVSEAEALFPYTLLHLGGDEVNYSCWEQDAEIVQWEADNGIDGSEGTYEYFVDRVATIARDQGRTPVQWVEVFEHFGR